MLEPGRQLLHYRLVEKLGEGGMGVVWRAVDTTLDREVAIKVLPDAFSQDTDRLARFEREAKALARLNHPNIASIHSVHEAEGVRFLAMELVSGEDLSERIARGPVPVDEALTIANGIATALEAAHAAGIVHRDLKPANVKLGDDGAVKVLDFGLAKAWTGEAGGDAPDPALSPTMTSAGTLVGVIIGTASYMSPEQARGRPVDQRADLWALGVILFEMLTGRTLFAGEDVSEILAGVIKGELEWQALPANLPNAVRLALRRCLERKPSERLHSAADLRILIEEGRGEQPAPVVAEAGAGRPSASRLPWLLLGVTLIGALAGLWWLDRGGSSEGMPSIQFAIRGSDELSMRPSSFAPFFDVAPDGPTIVFAAIDTDGRRRLYARDLDSLEEREIAGTEAAAAPFLGRDGLVGFVAQSELRGTMIGGLRSWTYCNVADGFSGATFAPDGSVIFSDDFDTGLRRVRERGGEVEQLTTPDRERGEKLHRLPYVLPSGRGIVFTIDRLNADEASTETAVLDLETGQISQVFGESYGPYRYIQDGYLLMLRAERMVVLPFDDDTLSQTGSPFPAFGDEATTMSGYAVSETGILAYTQALWLGELELVWVSRDGSETPISDDRGFFVYPSLSQQGDRVAVTLKDTTWIYELDDGRRTRLTQAGVSYVPMFSPDGSRVVFGAYRPEENLYWMPSDGSADVQLLLEDENRQYPLEWHATTDTILLQWTDPATGYDVRAISGSGEGDVTSVLATRHNERWAQLSPDGRWLVYASDESGRYEIYVVSYPDGRGKRAVSSDGGVEPRWSPKGDEIFYVDGGSGELYRDFARVIAVPVTSGETLEIGQPRALFEGDYVTGVCCGHGFDVDREGQRLMMVKGRPKTEATITVEVNAFERLIGDGRFRR